MNENLKTNESKGREQSNTDIVCNLLDEIGWLYDREGNKIQVVFNSDSASKVNTIVCVADILNDKVFLSTAVGIKADSEHETLKLLNFINTHKILYGRFVLSDDMSVWYDYTTDVKPSKMNVEQCYRAFSIAVNCCECFCNEVIDVAIGAKNAEQAIESIK